MVVSTVLRKVVPWPITSCCCGCPVVVGVYGILLCNLLVNVAFIVATAGNLLWQDPRWTYTGGSLPMEVMLAGFCLAGLPFILAGFLGCLTRTEMLVRAYLNYLTLIYGLSLIWMITQFVKHVQCSAPAMVNFGGAATHSFACGAGRIAAMVCASVYLAIPINMIVMVHSYAELLAYCVDTDLSTITTMRKTPDESRPWQDVMEGPDAFAYGSVSKGALGFGGSKRIFGGTYHSTHYP